MGIYFDIQIFSITFQSDSKRRGKGHNLMRAKAAGISNITISDCRFDLEHTCGIVGNGIAKLSNIVFRNLIFNIVNRLPGIDSHEIDCQRYDTNSPSLDTVLIFANTDIVLENVKLEFTPEIRSAWKHDVISGENVNLSGNYHK